MVDRIVVMGVAGSGKSTVALALAAQLGVPFTDADSLHPAANVAKMSLGVPLVDADRWLWLEAVRQVLRSPEGGVVACSALTRRYRDLLRGAGDVRFIFIEIDPATARERARLREGHFMGAGMIDSQFATLEPPMHDETDVLTVAAVDQIDALIDAIVAGLTLTKPTASALVSELRHQLERGF